MNAYQIPAFNAGTSTSPFNYFPQNTPSYGVISTSYGNPTRGSQLTHHHHHHPHKTMATSQPPAPPSSFVSPTQYFHQPHLQPFSTFAATNSVANGGTTASPVGTGQSSNGPVSPYTAHNHYSTYGSGTNSPSSSTTTTTLNVIGGSATNNTGVLHPNNSNNSNTNSTNNNNNSGASSNNFDNYTTNNNSSNNNNNASSLGGYLGTSTISGIGTTSNNSSNSGTINSPYPYIASCSTTGNNSSYSPYSTSAQQQQQQNSIANNSNNGGTTYHSTHSPHHHLHHHHNNTETYLNLCNNRIEANNEDIYTLNLNIKNENQLPLSLNNNNDNTNNSATANNGSGHNNKKVKRTGRGRTRRPVNHHQQSPSSPNNTNNIDRIFIWYLDETILSYLSISEYNRFTGFNDTHAASLYNEIFTFINKFAEKYLFLSDLKDIDQSHIDDSAADDNGQDLSNYNFSADGFKTSVSCNMGSTLNSADLRQKMALRYRKINETYTNFSDKLDELLDKSDYEQMQDLIKRFDLFSKNWIHPALKALSYIKTRPNCLNVLISSSPLIYTLAKMLIFQLGPYFPISNIYSCSKTSKEHTLNRVLNRYGSNCTYIVIGKGSDEQQLSQKLELPFWPITEREHFESLLNAAMHYFF